MTDYNSLIDWDRLPEHIAIIMDGNGRWAKKKGLPRIAGHRAGMETLKQIVSFSSEINLPVLTLYAFSTENWRRSAKEVDFLMSLPHQYLQTELTKLMENDVRVCVIGDTDNLPRHTKLAVRESVAKTQNNKGLILNFALNYGGRQEIIFAVRRIAENVLNNNMDIDEIDEELFSRYLETRDVGDPDLLIRPSGELRLSNFLLWQLAYAEFWFSNIYWPDFKKEHLIQAIHDYQQRDRRFGGIKL